MPMPRTPRTPLFAAPPPTPAARQHRLEALKICAVTSPEDAELVTRVAAKYLPSGTGLYVGMILWPRTRRAVAPAVAKEIARAARAGGAEPVAVFVDEGAREIAATCAAIGVRTAQLHGAGAKAGWAGDDGASDEEEEGEGRETLDWIEVRAVDKDGGVEPAISAARGRGAPRWTLFDAKGGGTGQPFDWGAFTPPEERWLLAGGLDADNVAKAVETLGPAGLDVATGVTKADRMSKDEARLHEFLERAVSAYS